MNTVERREKILQILKKKEYPVTGTELAQKLHVTRQIIVSDIAMMKAAGQPIFSSHTGYILQRYEEVDTRVYGIKCLNTISEENKLESELYTIVDNGGIVRGLEMDYENLGVFKAEMRLRSRRDVRVYLEKLNEEMKMLILMIMKGIHTLTIEISKDDEFMDIIHSLKTANLLYKEANISIT